MSTTCEKTQKFDLYQTVTNRVIELLEKGTIPWRKPWSSAGPPMNAISKRAYQGINLWMLLCLHFESNLYLTFKQIKQLNASVKKGEQGNIVVYWQIPEKPIEELATEEGKTIRPALRYHKVFNVQQCQGIPPSVLASNYERQNDPIKACEMVLENFSNHPGIVKGKRRAEYVVDRDIVHMPNQNSFESSEAYYTTFFHELIHSTGHEKRLNRNTLTEMAEFGSDKYSLEELVAELGSCFLASHTGILEKQVKNSTAYIQGWLGKLKNDRRFVVIASTQAQKACDHILIGKKKEPEEIPADTTVSN